MKEGDKISFIYFKQSEGVGVLRDGKINQILPDGKSYQVTVMDPRKNENPTVVVNEEYVKSVSSNLSEFLHGKEFADRMDSLITEFNHLIFKYPEVLDDTDTFLHHVIINYDAYQTRFDFTDDLIPEEIRQEMREIFRRLFPNKTE